MSGLVGDLVVAWFLGGGGLLLGCVFGWRVRPDRKGVKTIGFLIGAIAGAAMSLELTREALASARSTAAIGLLFVPLPPLTNGVGGWLGTLIVHGWRIQRHLPDATS